MKAWLKGGLIGAVLSLILNFIMTLLAIWDLPRYFFVILLSPTFLAAGGAKGLFMIVTISFIVNFIVYFIVGSIIGWIVGKVKGKKTNPPLAVQQQERGLKNN